MKYDELQRNENSRLSAVTRIYSTASCSDCSRLRSEIRSKEDLILNLRSDISNCNAKILTLEGQIFTFNATSSKPSVIYTQTVSRPNDL